MTEYSLPGLRLEIHSESVAANQESRPLSELLDQQQSDFGNAALMGWRRIAADDTNLQLSLETAALLRGNAQELLLIGMGGSINGARAIYQALELSGSVQCAVEFIDNPDPLSVIATLEVVDPEQSSVLAVSRSGSTVETLAMLAAVLQHVPAGRMGEDGPAMACCSLAGDNPLAQLAGQHGWKHACLPADIGGRFSVFTPAGLIPLAFCGIDVTKLTVVAAEVAEQLEGTKLQDNPAWQLSGMLLNEGTANAVLYSYGDVLLGFADWWKQLIAESTGRSTSDGNIGITPLAARGAADQHSLNQLFLDGPSSSSFCFLDMHYSGSDVSINRDSDRLPPGFEHLGGQALSGLMSASLDGTLQALLDSGRPCARMQLARPDEQGMASLLQLWMYITACLGIRLGINPYEQPAVERSKRITDELLRGGER